MEFRYMQEQDLEQVSRIEKDIFSKPWSKNDFGKAIKDSNNIYIVAKEGNCILGYCGLWGVAGEGQITNVAVDKPYRSQGIGEKLLTYLIQEGEKKGINAYTLEVRISNETAYHLYKKIGFWEAGIRKGFYEEPKEDARIMWLGNI